MKVKHVIKSAKEDEKICNWELESHDDYGGDNIHLKCNGLLIFVACSDGSCGAFVNNIKELGLTQQEL